MTDLCTWATNKGAPDFSILDVFEVIDSYLFQTPPTGYSFVPTVGNVFGIMDYYLGFNGDPLTGCHLFVSLYERYNIEGQTSWGCCLQTIWFAQTFTVGNTGANVNHYITKLKLKLQRLGSPGNITISIRATAGGLPTGGDLTAVTINGNTLPEYPGEWIEITLPPYLLYADTQYAIVVRAPGSPGSGNEICWWRIPYSTYTGGRYLESIFTSGATWEEGSCPNCDFLFEEYGYE